MNERLSLTEAGRMLMLWYVDDNPSKFDHLSNDGPEPERNLTNFVRIVWESDSFNSGLILLADRVGSFASISSQDLRLMYDLIGISDTWSQLAESVGGWARAYLGL